MHAQHATTLLLLALGAFLIPLLARRIRVPAAVGEILFGMLIGGHGLGLIERSGFTEFLGHFGFAFLMFLAGMEIDFSQVEKLGRKGLLVAGTAVALVWGLALGAVVLFDKPLFFVLALSAMSLGLVLVALRDTALVSTRLGQTVLIVGSLGEFLAIIALTVTDMSTLHGLGIELVAALAKLVAVFVIAWVVLVLLRTLVWWHPEPFERLVHVQDTSELAIRGSFALMLGFIAISILLGVEMILGAFIAGALIAFVFREKETVEKKLSSFGFGFFVPIFFIEVGVGFDVGGVLRGEFLVELTFLLVAGLVVRLLPMMLLPLVGLTWKGAASAGVILSAPLTLLVAISQVGLSAGLVSQQTAGTIVLYALVGGIVLPVLFRAIAPRVGGAPGGG